LKKALIVILSLVIFVLSALFFAQNDDLVSVNYFLGKLDWQLNWVMLACLFVGFLIGIFSILSNLIKIKIELKLTKNKLEQSKKELNNLRSLPIKDEY